MSTSELLAQLAHSYGISTEYVSNSGSTIHVEASSLVALLRAMGVALPSEPAESDLAAALQARHEHLASRPLPPALVGVEGQEHGFVVHVHDGAEANVHIELEDGSTRPAYQDENFNPPVTVDGISWGEASFHIPGDLPRGYHRIHLESLGTHHDCALIITPHRLSTTQYHVDHPAHGVMAQLYSVRSRQSWGMGDFHDLGDLAQTLADTTGADFLLVNPLHAAEPTPPVEDSPYLPTTRRFINPIYVRIEDVAEYAHAPAQLRAEIDAAGHELAKANTTPNKIERNPIYEAKLASLNALYEQGLLAETNAELDAFIEREGEGLEAFARWCATREIETTHSHRHAATVDAQDLARFYMWLQFLCSQQLEHAQQRALDAGMSIGLITDLAVGVHPGGADAATMGQWMAPEASVGAPPDPYNQHGQDWSQPPFNPEALAEAGYQPWREILSTVLRHSGGIRVDHILGLFRLFWMPRMSSPSAGTYVRYDHEAMLGILVLEAERAGAIVIGEDMGTFEHWVQDVLANKGVMGTSVLWFESDLFNGGPRQPQHYRSLAMSSVGTHDLPPTAGYLSGEHIRLREQLGVLTDDAATEDRQDVEWQNRVLDVAREHGLFHDLPDAPHTFQGLDRAERGSVEDLLVALHRYIASTPSALTCTNLVDLVGDVRVQNQPGTNSTQYANWCIPLCTSEGTPVLIEDLPELALVERVAQASRR
ncbi:4-alpha-glucanotransferase [Corynebacterium tapiri]|uniref:4-alpha-glucanotransferase n=1 Tax=Corynebacterium tapiri TaxID=1448266 RepID=A0A5C4U396_9CORY|nr:4-alpha-glucanotransferase [Corynebacterium tapiri]TNL96600.1 4-alpha-glucanotransferase [Corynebacterium tapiri]